MGVKLRQVTNCFMTVISKTDIELKILTAFDMKIKIDIFAQFVAVLGFSLASVVKGL